MPEQGVPAVTHAVVCHDEKNPDPKTVKLKLLVEGDNLLGVMGTRGKLLLRDLDIISRSLWCQIGHADSFYFILQVYCPIGISPMGNWGRCPQGKAAAKSCTTQPTGDAAFFVFFFGVAIIH